MIVSQQFSLLSHSFVNNCKSHFDQIYLTVVLLSRGVGQVAMKGGCPQQLLHISLRQTQLTGQGACCHLLSKEIKIFFQAAFFLFRYFSLYGIWLAENKIFHFNKQAPSFGFPLMPLGQAFLSYLWPCSDFIKEPTRNYVTRGPPFCVT